MGVDWEYTVISLINLFSIVSHWNDQDNFKGNLTIGVIDPAESKSGLIFDLNQLLLCHLAIFAENFQRFQKLMGKIVSQMHPCIIEAIKYPSLHLNSIMSYTKA